MCGPRHGLEILARVQIAPCSFHPWMALADSDGTFASHLKTCGLRMTDDTGMRDDWVVLAMLGTLVAIVGSVAHEAIGHGLGCALDGGTVTLLTFLVFRCDGAGWVADGGGPAGALIVGCLALILLQRSRPTNALCKLLLFTVASMLLFWFFAQMVKEAFDGSDDWGHVARDLSWPSQWHMVAAIVGALGYWMTFRVLRHAAVSVIDGRRLRLVVPYLGAALCAPILGALWHGGVLASAVDGLMTFAVAPFGHLLLLFFIERNDGGVGELIRRSRAFIGTTLVIVVFFAAVVAPGLGRLS